MKNAECRSGRSGFTDSSPYRDRCAINRVRVTVRSTPLLCFLFFFSFPPCAVLKLSGEQTVILRLNNPDNMPHSTALFTWQLSIEIRKNLWANLQTADFVVALLHRIGTLEIWFPFIIDVLTSDNLNNNFARNFQNCFAGERNLQRAIYKIDHISIWSKWTGFCYR